MEQVLEQLPPAGRGLIQQHAGVGPEPGKDRQIVRTLENIDRVELQDGDPIDDPAEVPDIDPAGLGADRRIPELRGQPVALVRC